LLKEVTPKVEINLPDLRKFWNCGVKVTIRFVADFDPKLASEKVLKLLEAKPTLVEKTTVETKIALKPSS